MKWVRLSCVVAISATLLLLDPGRGPQDPRRRIDRSRASPKASDLALVITRAYERAAQQWSRLPRVLPPFTLSAASLGAVNGTAWKAIGPSPITEKGCCTSIVFDANGRINSIAVDPANSNVIYLGSAGGGIWRSADGGLTWAPLTDQEASLGIGTPRAIAIDPANSNIIYAGTSSYAFV